MEDKQQINLEGVLKRMENDVEATMTAAHAVLVLLKKLRIAASVGDLKEIKRGVDLIEQSINALRQQFANTKEGWDIDEEYYLSKGGFVKELLLAASESGLPIFEQDDKLFSYPVLLRVLSQEKAVLIDKKRERRIRPSYLISHLKKLQAKPIKVKPEIFLEALFEGYSKAIALRGSGDTMSGQVIPLIDLYGLFTILPGQSREYPKQEFARDIYLLDQSGVTKTKNEYVVSFPASTATKSESKTIAIISRQGQEKKYYGISFRLEGQGEQNEVT